ncbi:iron-siderophore ABC transporter substrate-binding protein [Streptacidiphilus neutrinimicus]|uniref:iron-siderophore ABC transporter substrate-binding protein n=1 Tax=Streptacidiphilus neutrinimicus TaxID=105420 RepID=UPI0005AAD441|nr:iron-siderophore ABC transporter substrate-binding protein [Streptacidiphilus neutrinimicus]
MPRAYSRRALLGALGAFGASAALAGCKGDNGFPPDSGSAASPTSSQRGGGLLAVQAAPGSSSPSPPPTRTVHAATGPVQVPAAPRRVVVLGTAELDSALALGFTPVGAARPAFDRGLPDYYPTGWLSPVRQVGVVGTPDLAAIKRLRPDVILSSRSVDGTRFQQLSAIAPTVLTETTGASWKQDFQLHAQALDAQSVADAITSAYQGHVREVTAALGGPGATHRQQISVVRFVQDQSPSVIAAHSFLGVLLADVQLGRPAAQNAPTESVPLPTTDQLDAADGTTILYSTYGDPAKAQTNEVLNSSAWKNLAAVKAGRAHAVDDQLWNQGVGYLGSDLILAQLRRYLGG